MSNDNGIVYGENIELTFQKFTCEDLDRVNIFDCGNDFINKYFQREALDDTKGVTRIAWKVNSSYKDGDIIDKNNSEIIAMYTLSASAMFYEIDSAKYLIPAIEIKMFAVNKKYQNMPFSSDKEDGVFADWLLSWVIKRIREITDDYCGANKIILLSTPKAFKFYDRNLFEKIEYKDIKLLEILKGCIPMIFDLDFN